MPTMAGAFTYDLYKNYKILDANDVTLIGIGFVAAFLSGLVVVRGFLNFISRHGFKPFAWWRIVVGCFGLAACGCLAEGGAVRPSRLAPLAPQDEVGRASHYGPHPEVLATGQPRRTQDAA